MSPEDKQRLIDGPLCVLCNLQSVASPSIAIVLIDDQLTAVCARHASAYDYDASAEDDD